MNAVPLTRIPKVRSEPAVTTVAHFARLSAQSLAIYDDLDRASNTTATELRRKVWTGHMLLIGEALSSTPLNDVDRALLLGIAADWINLLVEASCEDGSAPELAFVANGIETVLTNGARDALESIIKTKAAAAAGVEDLAISLHGCWPADRSQSAIAPRPIGNEVSEIGGSPKDPPDVMAGLGLAISAGAAMLLAQLDAFDARTGRMKGDETLTYADWKAWSDDGERLLRAVINLPNTQENLRIRARAVGSGADNTADLANLDLDQLSAVSNGSVGELVRQILVVCAGRSARADGAGKDQGSSQRA